MELSTSRGPHSTVTGPLARPKLRSPPSRATLEGIPLHSQTVQAIAEEYATRRKQFKKAKLRWRVSNPDSSKYSLGWIPFKASAISYHNG